MESNNTTGRRSRKNALKQILSPPLLAFLAAIVLVLMKVEVPEMITTTTQYLGNLVTPLALIYIGIVLCDAGIKTLRFDRDTVVALIGKFVIAPAAMIFVIVLLAHTGVVLPKAESSTLIMQAAVPALTVLPVLANEGKGDVRYATSIVALSTILFVVAAPIVMMVISLI